MKSVLLLSILVAVVGIPALAARDPDPRRGVKRMYLGLLVASSLYVAYVTLLHPVLFVPQW